MSNTREPGDFINLDDDLLEIVDYAPRGFTVRPVHAFDLAPSGPAFDLPTAIVEAAEMASESER